MRDKLLLLLLSSSAFADLTNLVSFQADFEQTIINEQKKEIKYSGHINATQPYNALWKYSQPIHKSVYVVQKRVIIIEPDLEQAIIKGIDTNFDFFTLMQSAKEIEKDRYLGTFNNVEYTIQTKGIVLESISYIDEFENKVKIDFNNQEVNKKMDLRIFDPVIPEDYDIIKD